MMRVDSAIRWADGEGGDWGVVSMVCLYVSGGWCMDK